MSGPLKFINADSPVLAVIVITMSLLIIIFTVLIKVRREQDAINQPIKTAGKAEENSSSNFISRQIKLPRETNLHPFIAEIEQQWRSLIPAETITFTVFCDPRITRPLFVDEAALSKVIHALMGRAVSTTSQGRIHMHITEAQTLGAEDRPQLDIVIADTGRGMIAAEALSLQGTHYNFRVEDIQPDVQTLSGRLVHKSRLGRGAEFILTCPFMTQGKALTVTPDMEEIILEDHFARDGETVKAELEAQARILESRHKHRAVCLPTEQQNNLIAKLSGKTVLIVEDIESNKNAIRALLAPLESTLVYAANGREAINTLKTHLFDYIIMDVHLPGLSGIETTKIIRERELGQFHIPILGLTADTTPMTAQNALEAGMDFVVTKPVMSQTLFQAIHDSLAAHPRYKTFMETSLQQHRA